MFDGVKRSWFVKHVFQKDMWLFKVLTALKAMV